MPSREEKQWQHYEAAKTIRKIRKDIKRNRKPKRVRSKDWNTYNYADLDDLDELDFPPSERVMPRGERERRRAHSRKARSASDAEPDASRSEGLLSVEEMPGQLGIVIEVSSSLCRVDMGQRILVCSMRGSLSAQDTGYTNVVAVGDEVLVSDNGSDTGVVEAVLPRRSVFARPDVFYSHLQQVIVANADQLLIVASWREPHIWLELIDRYLIAAERYNLPPAICINKIDLAEDPQAPRTTLQPYMDLGYQVIFTSAISGRGISKLGQYLTQRTTVLAGLSGVGKSSLLSVVQPELELRIGQVNQQRGEGRHTTTQATMYRLERGGFVVDTPGIREFGLIGLHRNELARFYPEIATSARTCRFDNCSHIHEPGCAVREAVQKDLIPAARYHSYQKIYETLPT